MQKKMFKGEKMSHQYFTKKYNIFKKLKFDFALFLPHI